MNKYNIKQKHKILYLLHWVNKLLECKLLNFIIVTFLIFSFLVANAQTSPVNPCNPNGSCTANDFELFQPYLASDTIGTPLTTSDCDGVLPLKAYYFVRIKNNTGSQRIGIYVDALVSIGGVLSNITHCFNDTLHSNQIESLFVPTPIYWDCSSPINILESVIVWGTGSGSVCYNTGNINCSNTNGSKCRYGDTLRVITPLVSNFTYNRVCNPNQPIQTITYNDSSFGGDYPNVTYSWNFGTGATPATANTSGPHTVSYSTAGNKTVTLTVTNPDGSSDTKTKNVLVNTCCLFNVTCPSQFETKLSCEQPLPNPANNLTDLEALGFTVNICKSLGILSSDTRINGNCLNNYKLERSYTIFDDLNINGIKDVNENFVNCIQTITVQDTTNPMFVGALPQNITVNCESVPSAATLTATDNCGIARVSYNEQRMNGQCANAYTLTRTWIARDTCNNTTTHVQTITVQDTTKPTFIGALPQNITVNCESVPSAATLTATDNCGIATVSYNEQRTNGQCVNAYTLTRTWIARDICNNTTTHVQTITVQDTTKPMFVGALPQNITVNCEAVPLVVTLTATDNCGIATVSYNEQRTNGQCVNAYTLTRTWIARDTCNNTTTHVQTITVQDTTKPMFVGALPQNITVNCEAVPLVVTLTATDNCGIATVSYNEQRTNGQCVNAYTLTRTWIARDTCNNTTTHIQTIIVQDTTKPVFVGALPQDIIVNCESVPSAATLTATDNCGIARVSYNEQRMNGQCANAYTLTRTWIARDTCNNTTTHVQTITVQDTTKPTFIGALPQNITVNCESVPPTVTLTSTDNCGIASVSYNEQRANGQCANAYTLTRTWIARDTCNNTTTHVQTITVQDTTKPVFVGALPQNITVNCESVPSAATLTATDNCGNASVSYNEQRTNGQCANAYILTRTWIARDTCNNTTTHVQTITVQDTTKPTFVGALPQNIIVNCESVPSAATLTATDNCGNASVSYNEQRTNGQCANAYILTRTWIARDTCNNTTTHVQTITVQDTTKPTFVGALPQNITVNCEAVPLAVTLTATDNCGIASVSYNEQRTNGQCANAYTLTRTWIAKDTCNNTTTHIQTITVQDTTKPTFIGALPQDVTVNCESIPAVIMLTATDNCGNASVSYNEQRTNGQCANTYTLTRTWIARDTCNNTTTHVQTITVQDTTKPVFVGALPQNITVNCESVPPTVTLTATDNCGTARVSFNEQRTDGQCVNAYTLTRTWIARDTCNNTTTHVQTITVQDTTKPTFVESLPQNITVNCEAVPPAITLTAIDNCGEATVDYNEQKTNVQCGNSYNLIRTWIARDACNNTTTHVQTITVQDTTKPMFVGTLPQDVTVNCDDIPAAVTLTATDNCGTATVSYDEQRTNGQCNNAYTLTRTWTAKDTCNNTTTHIQTITVQDTTKPVFVGVLPLDVTVNCESVPPTVTLTATDNCGIASVSYNEQRMNGQCANAYTLTRTWIAKDTCNNTTTHIQTITVQDTTKPMFVGTLPQNITVNCESVPLAITLTATDNCGAASVSYNEQRANGQCANAYTLTRTWIAKDTCNNTTTHVQTIIVQDTTKPTFVGALPQNIIVNCESVSSAATLTATDNCGTASVSYNEQRTNGQCANAYTLTRTWIAKDTCNNTTTHVQTITVQDTTKPVFVGVLPQNVTVNCESIPAVIMLTASDNCGNASVSYNEQRTNGQCANTYTLTRTWIARDTCNNTTTHVQTITVQDTTKPVFVGALPQNITVNCESVPSAATLTATDNCGEATVRFDQSTTPGGCSGNGGIIRTWTARDTCGNTTTYIQRITVQDTTKPSFVESLPADITVNCDDIPLAVTLTAIDNCGTASVSYNEQRTNGQCANAYTLTRTWIARDTCNNTTTHVQTITVQDTTKPMFVGALPQNITVNCEAVPLAVTLTATDNCGTARVSFNEQRTDGQCVNAYTLTRTWIARDTCNNTTTHVQTITVQDTTKPMFVGALPQNITVNCEAVPLAVTLTATDNCGDATVSYDEQRTNGQCVNAYTLTRMWTARDTCNNTTIHVQTITVQDTTKPMFVGALPQNITVNCEAVPLAVTLTATDNCGTARVSFNEQRTDGQCVNAYTLTRTWIARDTCNNTTTHVQTITVQDTTKPIFVGALPQNITVNCESVPSAATLTATDNCGIASVSYNEQRMNGQCANAYTLTRTWIAKDTCGNTITHIQTITVQDTTKPTFIGALPQDVTVNCESIPAAVTLTATDNCGTATVSYDEQRTSGQCNNAYTLTRTWTARDTCNNTTSHVQTITVQDTTKPTFVGALPQNITVNCESVPVAVTLTATDNCGTATVSYDEQRTNGQCVNAYTLTRTWTARDACNNTTSHVQTITVQDTTKPMFVGALPQDIIVCNNIPTPDELLATDNCNGNVAVQMVETVDSTLYPFSVVITRTWTAIDDCENSSSHTQIITVNQILYTQIDTTICEGNNVIVGDSTFTLAGDYTVILTNRNNCDSIIKVHLNVNPKTTFTIDTLIFDCHDPILINGQTYTETGNYEIILENSLGCDSIVYLNLNVRTCDTIPPSQDTILYDTLTVITTLENCNLSIPPGNIVSISSCEGDTNTIHTTNMGSWTVNPVTNCLEYTAGSYEGNDTLCITICDNRRQCNSTTVIITILGLPPLALDDCVEELDMNMSKTINVILNDSDIDHDTIVINSIVQEPKFGIASYTQNGNITYTPNRNFCGRDTLYYEICDNDDGCDTAMLCLHIKCECILPQAITPNNDGFNDYLFFPCITGVDNVRLLVWHRWGLIIYENFNYKNDWQGMLKGELLPAGTYWYSIEYTDPETNEQVKEVNYFMIIN